MARSLHGNVLCQLDSQLCQTLTLLWVYKPRSMQMACPHRPMAFQWTTNRATFGPCGKLLLLLRLLAGAHFCVCANGLLDKLIVGALISLLTALLK